VGRDAMTRTRTPESQVLRQCLQLLRFRRIPAWRANSGGMRVGGRYVRFASADGLSDIVGALPPSGRMLLVETKILGGRLTAAQSTFLTNMAAAGALCLVVSDPKQLDEALKAEGVW
jgi:hypothetical protein